MKWFQVDADTPNDPKIVAIREACGLEGLGALFLLWCFVADHGTSRPGSSLDSKGRPIPIAAMRHAALIQDAKFDALIQCCVDVGHFDRRAWLRKVITIPAMATRADTYTNRKASGALDRRPYGKSGMTRRQIFERDNYTCEHCGEQKPADRLEVDHRLPKFRGGTDDPTNLTTSCKSCNRTKGSDKLRADGRRRVPSTLLVENSTNLPDKTVQDQTDNTPLPPARGGRRYTRADLQQAKQIRKMSFARCPHDPRCAGAIECEVAIAIEIADRRRAAGAA